MVAGTSRPSLASQSLRTPIENRVVLPIVITGTALSIPVSASRHLRHALSPPNSSTIAE